MDKNAIVIQHNNIKTSLQKNIDYIKDLIEESDDIKKIIEQLRKHETHKHLANDLEKSLENINKSITNLLNQTNFMYDSYKDLIHFTFKN